MHAIDAPALVLVTSSFPIRSDGSEAAGSFVADLAEELALHGHLRVVAPGLQAKRERWSERIEIFRYAAPSRPLSTLRPWRPQDFAWIARILRGGAATTCEAARSVAHVFALWALPCGEWARRAALANGIDYSVWMLGSDVWSLGRVPVVRDRLARVIRQARHAYADGYKLAEDAQRIAGVQVKFLPSTRRIHATHAPPRAQPPYRLLFLGRWHPNKGIDLLLDSLSLLDDSDWVRIGCVEIQGGGPLESLVRARISVLQARGRPLILGGFLGKPEAEDAIARADWVLIPSRIESIPVIFSDAMKLGRPVIATPVGDLPRLIANPCCGELADAVNVRAFCRAIRRAVSASPREFDGALRVQAARFDLSLVAGQLLAGACRGV